jgi:transposase InsO family protein
MTITTKPPDGCQWQEAEALKRFQMIAPLQDEDLDSAKRIHLRRLIAEKYDLSEKTIKRYDDAYQEKGFEGLKPKSRTPYNLGALPANYEELLQEAIQLRREIPSRSVEKIITILELENKVAPGVLNRSTLQRHLFKAGFGKTHLQTHAEARKTSSKRFCKPHRMMLIQGDIKFGPILPIGENGEKVQTYLSSAIDDHSRMILFSRFYDNQEEEIVEDTFHKAILRFGSFDACYFDNGKQFIAKQLKLSLAKLSIRIAHAPVDSGKSKGKIEKFHQVVDSYLAEAKAKKIRTLEDLNRYWTIFLDEYYHKKPHNGIREYYESLGVSIPSEGITPVQEFNRDSRALTFLDASVVAEAFLHHETRNVDKGACISFRGRRYETKSSLIGFTVEIAYDPGAPDILTVSYPGIDPFQARPLEIGEYCDPVQELPASMQAVEPETSRFLDALEKHYNESKQRRADAISFGIYRKEVSDDV